MKFTMDFSEEFEIPTLFPEGWHKVSIVGYSLRLNYKSKGFYVYLVHPSSNIQRKFWISMEKGTRFKLKKLLEATEVYKTDIEGNYKFDIDDLIGRVVMARFTIEKYIYFEDGKGLTRKRNEVTDFKKAEFEEKQKGVEWEKRPIK
ncbi:MAG: hypothetical protein LBQ13_04320 [Endomicrobium sp.]|jgi:hypothetical protein|nr:hypothetical protein [Endomicrobium sp.]